MSTPTATTGTSTSASDIVTNLANFLPTGTFLAFQAIAPLFTNNGTCGNVEVIMTGLLIITFSVICFVLTYTDSITTAEGKVYYGIVTSKGLYNPQFNGSGITGVDGSFYTANPKDFVTIFDSINAVLAVVVLDTLALLTPPVSTCFFPKMPSTVIKCVPILVGIIAAVYFSFAPPPRKGVGYALTGLINTVPTAQTTGTADASAKTEVQQPLLTSSQKATRSTAESKV